MRMSISTGTLNGIIPNALDSRAVSGEQAVFNQIKNSPDSKDQLMKTAQEFESVFITKILSTMEDTVDKSGSLFEEKSGGYLDSFKPYMYQELGRNLASNPNTTFGLAKMIYNQMEKHLN